MTRDAASPRRALPSGIAASPLAWVVAAFVISRLLFRAAGVAFQEDQLGWFWQLVDPALLRQDLARSLLYLHAQPPLFNLFLGVVLKAFPGHEAGVLSSCFWMMGLLLHVSLFLLMAGLGVGRRASALLTIAFLVSPGAILYENCLLYTGPVASLLCVSALLFHRCLSRPRAAEAFAFFAVIAAVALLVSSFHLAWCLAAAALLLALSPREARRRAAVAAALPLGLVLALYAKNAALFGEASASTWFGMNIAKVTVARLPAADQAELFREGAISKVALITPFAPLSMYPAKWREAAPRGIPVLDEQMKSSGAQNYNHAAYIEISRQYLRDARSMIRRRPGIYAENVGLALRVFALPASDLFYLDANREKIQGFERAYDVLFSGALGALGPDAPRESFLDGRYLARHAAYGWMLLLLLGVAGGIRLCAPAPRGGDGNRAAVGTTLFLLLNILYVTLVSNAFELGENNRFRFLVDPLILALAAATVAAWRRTRARS